MHPDTTTGRMFGSTVLKAHRKVFAMLVNGALVVNLSHDRVARLIAVGQGDPFDPRHRRVSAGWVAIPITEAAAWQRFVAEARSFVAKTP